MDIPVGCSKLISGVLFAHATFFFGSAVGEGVRCQRSEVGVRGSVEFFEHLIFADEALFFLLNICLHIGQLVLIDLVLQLDFAILFEQLVILMLCLLDPLFIAPL